MIKEALYKFLYLLFPRRCDLCGDVVEFDKARCNECVGAQHISGDICDRCGREQSHCKCKKNDDKMEYKSVCAPYYFEGNIVKAVHRFKFYGFKELSAAMGKEIALTVKKRYNDVNFDLVTYVPLTGKRLKKRGYNQSLLLAQYVSDELNIPCVKCLVKVRDTESQRSQSAKNRKLNVFGAYDIADDVDFTDKTILIVDDVKTTGNTLNECAKMLKGYKAKAVYAASFAVAKQNDNKK